MEAGKKREYYIIRRKESKMELTVHCVSKKFKQNAAVDQVDFTLHEGVYGLL